MPHGRSPGLPAPGLPGSGLPASRLPAAPPAVPRPPPHEGRLDVGPRRRRPLGFPSPAGHVTRRHGPFRTAAPAGLPPAGSVETPHSPPRASAAPSRSVPPAAGPAVAAPASPPLPKVPWLPPRERDARPGRATSSWVPLWPTGWTSCPFVEGPLPSGARRAPADGRRRAGGPDRPGRSVPARRRQRSPSYRTSSGARRRRELRLGTHRIRRRGPDLEDRPDRGRAPRRPLRGSARPPRAGPQRRHCCGSPTPTPPVAAPRAASAAMPAATARSAT